MVGAPEPLIDGIRDLFAAAARQPDHVTMHVTLSRGCAGEPDDPSCRCDTLVRAQGQSLDERMRLSLEAVSAASNLAVQIDIQLSLYVLGQDRRHMDEIYGCIEFLKTSGTFLTSKNLCTRLRGDAGAVFEGVMTTSGADITAVWVTMQHETGRLVYNSDNEQINAPADLSGKTYAASAAPGKMR